MSVEVHLLQRIAVTEESTVNFASDRTGSATYLDVPFQEGSATLALNKPQLDTLVAQQYKDARAKTVHGPIQAELSFTMPLHPLGVALDDSTSALTKTDAAILQILSTTFGGFRSGQGSTVASAASASQFTVQTGHGTRFLSGGAVIRTRTGDSFAELRGVAAVASDTLTLKMEFSNTPSASQNIYNASTIYLTEDPQTSLQFIVEGAEQNDRWLVYGAQLSAAPALSITLGEIPTITFTFQCAAWKNLTGSAITQASYSNYNPVYAHGEFLAQVTGTRTRQTLDVASVAFTLNGPVYLAQNTPGGKNDSPLIKRYVRNRAVPIAQVGFNIPYEDQTFFTERDDRDDYLLCYQIGSEPGKIVAIEVPTAQISDVQRTDENGLAYQTVTGMARLDTDGGSQSVEIRRSAVRIHFG